MAITDGMRVVGFIVNQGHRVEFTGTVIETYRIGGRPAAVVSCDDGPTRTALADNVDEIKAAPKLTENMVKSLRNLIRHETVSASGTRAMNEKGCTFPALEALVRRGLAEVVDSGEMRKRFDGGTYVPKVYRATPAGRQVNDSL